MLLDLLSLATGQHWLIMAEVFILAISLTLGALWGHA